MKLYGGSQVVWRPALCICGNDRLTVPLVLFHTPWENPLPSQDLPPISTPSILSRIPLFPIQLLNKSRIPYCLMSILIPSRPADHI